MPLKLKQSVTFLLTGKSKNNKELDTMWKKIDELVAVVNNTDKVIEKIINRCQNTELKLNDFNYEIYSLDLKKEFDVKLTACRRGAVVKGVEHISTIVLVNI